MSFPSSKKVPSDCEAQCPDCGVTLARLGDMNRHRRSKHPDGTETKFPCPWFGCGYEATQKGNLKTHFDARHSDGPKYPCPECSRRFTDAAARIRHRKRIHGYVPHHTKEYLARQALDRKERVVKGASKAVSDNSRPQQVPAVPVSNASSSAPPPAPKLPEVSYHDVFCQWKMPVDITHLYPPQPPPFQDVPLFLPFETWPGYGTPNTIQNFTSAEQLPPSLNPSELSELNFTTDYHSASPNPQLYAQYQEQGFGESLTGNHNMPPYNNGSWNW